MNMETELKIGERIRPRGAINYGTLGFFCSDNQNKTYLASCDHVLKTRSTPDGGPWKIYYPRNALYQKKVALFEGKSLVNSDSAIADFAIAETLVPIHKALKLPIPLPHSGETQFTGIESINSGQEIMLWGATTELYINGVILAPNGDQKYSWPHIKYGWVKYDFQFSIALLSDYTPQVGDSGGYVVTKTGKLVGIVAALSGEVTESGVSIIHCVPVKQCLDELGLKLLTNMEG